MAGDHHQLELEFERPVLTVPGFNRVAFLLGYVRRGAMPAWIDDQYPERRRTLWWCACTAQLVALREATD
ncbi:hypothetical protein [Hydrogenophaga intermedia]|uniref:hypothetical protein n=1 Tax=Hydrogenophaga intermedia TaxID=65786 RepID=UPI00204459EC|nr:hypothetical protein [Hydrogenophaga intermedia]MCM3565900.1 hypothetical protein [Hydrogenophaga intermedia]